MGVGRLRVTGVALASAAALVSGCGSSSSAPSAGGNVVRINERDFHIAAPLQLKAGHYVFRAHNAGPDMHELIVISTPSGKLPLRKDGFTVDEDAVTRAEAGALEPGQPGAVRDLPVTLKPGRYLLICNMAGHYVGGMRTRLVVS